MVWNKETVDLLSKYFVEPVSDKENLRVDAEKALTAAAGTANCGLAVLRFIAEIPVEDQISQGAAVYLKNLWVSSSDTPIPDGEKTQITSLIVPLLLSTSPTTQTALSEALGAIEGIVFPWSVMVPDLRSSLGKAFKDFDLYSLNGILCAVNVLYKKFGVQLDSPDLEDHKEEFAALLLKTIDSISGLVKKITHMYSPTLCELIEAQRVSLRIFCSLKSLSDNELFSEVKAYEWMDSFKKYSVKSTCWATGVTDALNFAHDMRTRRSKLFDGEILYRKYMKEFIDCVINLFEGAETTTEGCEQLLVSAIKFLTAISTSVYHEFLVEHKRFEQIWKIVIIPHVALTGEDEQHFERDHGKYMMRDLEGSGSIRKVSCELLKGISVNHRDLIHKRVSTLVGKCLEKSAENPNANWKDNECAIYIVASFSTKEASIVTTHVVDDFINFLTSVVVPVLEGQEVDALPMLKAGALQFIMRFGEFIPKHIAMSLVGNVVRLLDSNYIVVQSYAACSIENILLLKENKRSQLLARYKSADILPFLSDLMNNLFGALENENVRVMRCLTRMIETADQKNQQFNHVLFENFVTLVPKACEKNPALLPAFEAGLMPGLEMILAKDSEELHPYAFQLLSQLVDLKRYDEFPQKYKTIFNQMMLTYMWETPTNVPALTYLYQAFVRYSPNLLKRIGNLEGAVEIFKYFVSLEGQEHWGFHILSPMIENMKDEDLAQHMDGIWSSLYIQLKNSNKPRLVRCCMIFLSLYSMKHGTRKLIDLINGPEVDMVGCKYHVLLREFWIPNLGNIRGDREVKLSVVATVKLMCESASLVDPAAKELWGKLLEGIAALLFSPPQEWDKPELAHLGEVAATYQILPKYVRVHYAGKEHMLKDIGDPKQVLVTSLAKLSSQVPGRLQPLIETYLSHDARATLNELCTSFGCNIV